MFFFTNFAIYQYSIMTKQSIIDGLCLLGSKIQNYLQNIDDKEFHFLMDSTIQKARFSNPWFIDSYIKLSLENISNQLNKNELTSWSSSLPDTQNTPKRVAIIMAGNIPLVGFQDLLSVLIAGHFAFVKLSNKDSILLTFIKDVLVSIDNRFDDRIIFEQNLLKNFDAVIATGSNNSARYFEYYFGKYPSIIRHNRNSLAIIHDSDNASTFKKLNSDILLYFGLGCRSVSKLFVPTNFDFAQFYENMSDFNFVIDNFKYFNNYEFNRSIFLINKVDHLDNGYLIFKQDQSLQSPVSVVHFEYYDDEENLKKNLNLISDQIQCIVSSKWEGNKIVKPGQTQFPRLNDWADDINVLEFLLKL
jgi:hypothetical protein